MDLFELGIVGFVIIIIFLIIVGLVWTSIAYNYEYNSALSYCGNEATLTHQYESYYCNGMEITCNDTNCFPVNIPSNMKRVCSPYYNVALKMMMNNCHYEKEE